MQEQEEDALRNAPASACQSEVTQEDNADVNTASATSTSSFNDVATYYDKERAEVNFQSAKMKLKDNDCIGAIGLLQVACCDFHRIYSEESVEYAEANMNYGIALLQLYRRRHEFKNIEEIYEELGIGTSMRTVQRKEKMKTEKQAESSTYRDVIHSDQSSSGEDTDDDENKCKDSSLKPLIYKAFDLAEKTFARGENDLTVNMATVYAKLGEMDTEIGDFSGAIRHYRRSLSILERQRATKKVLQKAITTRREILQTLSEKIKNVDFSISEQLGLFEELKETGELISIIIGRADFLWPQVGAKAPPLLEFELEQDKVTKLFSKMFLFNDEFSSSCETTSPLTSSTVKTPTHFKDERKSLEGSDHNPIQGSSGSSVIIEANERSESAEGFENNSLGGKRKADKGNGESDETVSDPKKSRTPEINEFELLVAKAVHLFY